MIPNVSSYHSGHNHLKGRGGRIKYLSEPYLVLQEFTVTLKAPIYHVGLLEAYGTTERGSRIPLSVGSRGLLWSRIV